MHLNERQKELIARIGLWIFGGILPGMFLGALLSYALGSFNDRPGLLGLPGVAPALIALEAVVGAVLLANWRAQRDLRGALFLPVLCMAGLSLYPEPLAALVAGGILLGGYLVALPNRTETLRGIFCVSLAGSFFLLSWKPEWALDIRTAFFPLVLAGAVLWSNARWYFRCAFIVILIACSILFANGSMREFMKAGTAAADNAPAALPASLMPAEGAGRIFVLSANPVPLLLVWGGLPYVRRVDTYWPYRDLPPLENSASLTFITGSPRGVIAGLEEKYKLIYLDLLPFGETVRRGFLDRIWGHLEEGGVMIVPESGRFVLPDGAHWVFLPGSDETLIAVAAYPLNGDPEVLESRLQRLQLELREDGRVVIPAGILSAVYTSTGNSREMLAERPLRVKSPLSHFYIALAAVLAGYWIIRVYFERQGRNTYGFALFENSASLALLLLAAQYAMLYRQFFTGVAGMAVWGCAALAVLALPLRPKAERLFGWLILLLPGIWLLPSVFSFEPSWLIVAGVAALVAGSVRGRIIKDSEFPRSWSLAFCAAGWIFAGALYALLTLLLPDSLLAVLLLFTGLKLPNLLKL